MATSAALVVAVFLSPVLLYSSQYAEHSLAAGLIVLAASYAVSSTNHPSKGGRPFIAGALVALAATVRPEGYCAVAALGVAVALDPCPTFRDRVRVSLLYLAGALPILLVYWGVNYASADTWDLAFNRNRNRSASMAGAFTMLFGEIKGARAGSWLAALALPVAVGLIPERLRRGHVRLGIHVLVGVVLCVLALRAHGSASGRTLVGLFALTPVCAIGLLASPWNARTRLPWLLAVGFVLQVLLFDKSGTAGGLQFGARFLLPALPLLVVLAASVAEEDWKALDPLAFKITALLPVLVLIGLTGWFMWRGQPQATKIAEDGWKATECVVDAGPDVVVTRRFWESQVLAPAILEGKKLFYVRGGAQRLVQRLADTGVREFVYISRGDVNVSLRGNLVARVVQTWDAWLPVQLVRIEPRVMP